MTAVIKTGGTLSVGSGAIIQAGAVEPTTVSYDGVVDTRVGGNTSLNFSLNSFPEGSLMILCVGCTDQNVPTAAGWTLVTSNTSGVGNGHAVAIYSKVKSGDSAITTFCSSGNMGGFVTSYSDASNVNAFAQTDSSFNTTLSYPGPNSNPIAAGSLVVRFGFVDSGGTTTFNPFSGHTKIAQNLTDTGKGVVLWHYDSQAGGNLSAGSHTFGSFTAYGTGTTIVINN